MAKTNKGATMSRLHSAARLSRTALASACWRTGFYAGQDQIMLALSTEDGQTPGQLAGAAGGTPADHHQDDRPASGSRFPRQESLRPGRAPGSYFPDRSGPRNDPRHREIGPQDGESWRSRGSTKKEQKALTKLLARIEANLSNGELIEIDDDLDTDD